jgi:serine/threonine protein kinase
MNIDDISNYAWELVSTIGKGGSSTVYKASIQPINSIVNSAVTTAKTPSISANSSPTRARSVASPLTPSIPFPYSLKTPHPPHNNTLSQHSLPPLQYVAVKEIDLDALNKNQIDSIQSEINTMKDLNHNYIVRYYGMQQRFNRIYIFMEYAKYGSIRQFYQKYGRLSENETVYCLKQILLGLNYLHSIGVAHRDIKCANCLLFDDGVVKLADFGASKRFESESIVSGLKGTPHWMAPEVIKGDQMTTGWMKADVWSVGCTVVEMITGKLPYAYYENPITAMYRIASGEIPKIFYEMPKKSARGGAHHRKDAFEANSPMGANNNNNNNDDEHSPNDNGNANNEIPLKETDISSELINFIEICCALDPNQRPPIEQLIKHPLLEKYENQELPMRLFTLEEEPLIPIGNSLNFQSITINTQLNRYHTGSNNNGPNTFSTKTLGLQSMDGNFNIPSQPLTCESQATPAMGGIRRNFSNFDESLFMMNEQGMMAPGTAGSVNFNLPPKSSHSYINTLAFSREGTANNNNYINGGLNYYNGGNYSNPPSQRSNNRFSADPNNNFRLMTASSIGSSHSDDFDVIKQSKLGDLLVPMDHLDAQLQNNLNMFDNGMMMMMPMNSMTQVGLGVASSADEGETGGVERAGSGSGLVYRNNSNSRSAGVRISSSNTSILAPIKSMDMEEIEDEVEHYIKNQKKHNHRYGYPGGVNENENDDDEINEEFEGLPPQQPNAITIDGMSNTHQEYHYEDEFEALDDEEDEDQRLQMPQIMKPDTVPKAPSVMNAIPSTYRYQMGGGNGELNDSFEDSGNFLKGKFKQSENNVSSSVSPRNMSTNNSSNSNISQMLNLTPVKLQSKSNMKKPLVIKSEEAMAAASSRPIAPLTSEKLQFTGDGGELSPVKEHHLTNSQPISLRNSRDGYDTEEQHRVRPKQLEVELNLISQKALHQQNDVVQLSPMVKDSQRLSFNEKDVLLTPMQKLIDSNAIVPGVTPTPANLAADNLKVQKAGTNVKVGAKFIHHPPTHQRNNANNNSNTNINNSNSQQNTNNMNSSAGFHPQSHRKHNAKTPTTTNIPTSPSHNNTQELNITGVNNNNNQQDEMKTISSRPHKLSAKQRFGHTSNNQNNNNNKEYVIISTQMAAPTSRSVSAGPGLVSSHSIKSLHHKGKKHYKGKKLNPNALKLPPLEGNNNNNNNNNDSNNNMTKLPTTANHPKGDGASDDDSTENFGERYVQSAPAITRSVNLPAIRAPHHPPSVSNGPNLFHSQTIPNSQVNYNNNNYNNSGNNNQNQNVLTSITPHKTKQKFRNNNSNNGVNSSSSGSNSLFPAVNVSGSSPSNLSVSENALLSIHSNKAKLLDNRKAVGNSNNNVGNNPNNNNNNSNNNRLQSVPEQRTIAR